MLDIDFMSEQEIIKILHNESQLAEIITVNVICCHEEEEQTLCLWHLFDHVSPKHQDNDSKIPFTTITKLLAKYMKMTTKELKKEYPKDHTIVFQKVYFPFVYLINKLSINRACELVANENIKKLLFDETLDIETIYNTISCIQKPSVLKILLEQAKKSLTMAKKTKSNYQEIKASIKIGITQTAKYSPSQIHFKQQYQGIVAKEKNNEKTINFYNEIIGYINHTLSQIASKTDERKDEKIKQLNIEQREIYLESLQNQIPTFFKHSGR